MLALVQPSWHFHTGLEKTGEVPHPHNSQSGQSITAVGHITGFLQVHETSSVHCGSGIILFIHKQWKLNKITVYTHTHTEATGKDTKLLPYISLGIEGGGGGDLFPIM